MPKPFFNKPILNFDDFSLPFMKNPYPEECGEEDENSDRIQIFETMENALPKSAIHIGSIENDVDHSPGLSWKIEDHYYLVPLRGKEFEWALFRITWDDNWGRYEWASDVRGSGFSDSKEAARVMVAAMFESWSFDLKSDEFEIYRDFLKKL
jgi:hypothetical protein